MRGNRAVRSAILILLTWTIVRLGVVRPWEEEKAVIGAPQNNVRSKMQASASASLQFHPVAQREVFTSHLQTETRALHLHPVASPRNSVPDQTQIAAVRTVAVADLPSFHSLVEPAPEDVSHQIPAKQVPKIAIGERRAIEGYAWTFVRGRAGVQDLARQGQLSGSQAGLRLSFPLARTVKASVRLSRSLGPIHDAEAAVGLTVKPLRSLPIELGLERRFGVGRSGRSAFATGISGGVDQISLLRPWSLSGYGQAGVVGLSRGDAYADGALRLDRPLSKSMRAGVQVSGAAQPRVRRLDMGPRLEAGFPIGRTRLSAAIEWRQRLAGNAAPGSGPVMTVSAGF